MPLAPLQDDEGPVYVAPARTPPATGSPPPAPSVQPATVQPTPVVTTTPSSNSGDVEPTSAKTTHLPATVLGIGATPSAGSGPSTATSSPASNQPRSASGDVGPTSAATTGLPASVLETSSSTPVRYYTYKTQVPLKPGQILGFTRGKGYYARDPSPKPTQIVTKATPSGPSTTTTGTTGESNSHGQPTTANGTAGGPGTWTSAPIIIPGTSSVTPGQPGVQIGESDVFPVGTGYYTSVLGTIVVTQKAIAEVDWSAGSDGSASVYWDPASGDLAVNDSALNVTDKGLLSSWNKRVQDDQGLTAQLLIEKKTVANPLGDSASQTVTIAGKQYVGTISDIETSASLTIEDGYPTIELETSMSVSVGVGKSQATVKMSIVTDATLERNVGQIPPLLVPVLVVAVSGGGAALGVLVTQIKLPAPRLTPVTA